MKILIVIVAACGVVGIGFFLFTHYIYVPTPSSVVEELPTPTTTRSLEGVVTAVNLDGMMVDGPGLVTLKTADGESHTIALASMGRSMCVAKDTVAEVSEVVIGDTVRVSGTQTEDGNIIPCESVEDYFNVVRTYTNTDLGVSFTYDVGPHGFTLTEATATVATINKGGVVLMETTEAQMLANREDSEGPPTITVQVYENKDAESAAAWIETHPLQSNNELKIGEPKDVVVGGVPAIEYLVDGLYRIDTIIVAHDSSIYVVTGSYLEENSLVRSQFLSLIQTLTFIPEMVTNQ